MAQKLTSYGIMGGTFDPIHYGHLITAEEAYAQFNLDKVIFMPSGHPPHKRKRKIISAEDRYLMTLIATASNPHFEVSRLEIDRLGPSYAIDTVRALLQIYGTSAEIYFITGADAILEILTWREAEKLCELCSFIAATRPGYPLEKFKQLCKLPEGKILEKNKMRIHFMEIPALAISSTDLRQRVREGKPIKYLLPESVVNYIYKSGLYKDSEGTKRN